MRAEPIAREKISREEQVEPFAVKPTMALGMDPGDDEPSYPHRAIAMGDNHRLVSRSIPRAIVGFTANGSTCSSREIFSRAIGSARICHRYFSNSCPEKLGASLRRVGGAYSSPHHPNHYDRLDGEAARQEIQGSLEESDALNKI